MVPCNWASNVKCHIEDLDLNFDVWGDRPPKITSIKNLKIKIKVYNEGSAVSHRGKEEIQWQRNRVKILLWTNWGWALKVLKLVTWKLTL